MEKEDVFVSTGHLCQRCAFEVEKERRKMDENRLWDRYELQMEQARRKTFSSPAYFLSLWAGFSCFVFLLVVVTSVAVVNAYYSCKETDEKALQLCHENQIGFVAFFTVCATWVFIIWVPMVIVIGGIIAAIAISKRATSHVYLPYTNPEK